FVLGEPGIGKSRLGQEFASRVEGRASVLRGACRSYGEDMVWTPVAEIIQAHAGISEHDDPEAANEKLRRHLESAHPPEEARLIQSQLGPLMGAGRGGVASEGEIVWAVRWLLEGAVGERP